MTKSGVGRASRAVGFILAIVVAGCSPVTPAPVAVNATPTSTTSPTPSAVETPSTAQPTPSAVATPTPTARLTPAPTRPLPFVDPRIGAVVFGTHFDPTDRRIDRPGRFGAQGFARGIASICWSAQFAVVQDSDSVTQLFARIIAGGGARPLQSEVVIVDQSHRVHANCADLATLAGQRSGTYRLSFLDGEAVLATGTFRLH